MHFRSATMADARELRFQRTRIEKGKRAGIAIRMLYMACQGNESRSKGSNAISVLSDDANCTCGLGRSEMAAEILLDESSSVAIT